MQSKTDEFVAELEAYDIEEHHVRSFQLYEEYTQRPIADTIRERIENFEKAGFTTKRQPNCLMKLKEKSRAFVLGWKKPKVLTRQSLIILRLVSRACFLDFQRVSK